MGQPSSLQTVDDRGYVFVTEAADCQIVSSQVEFDTDDNAVPLPATPLAGRRRMYIKNLSNGSSDDLYVGGADVTTSNGYQLAIGDEIILEVTDDIIVYGRTDAAAGSDIDVRILELA